VLRPGRPVAEALAALLQVAARNYVTDPAAAGCLALEGTRCDDPGARECAAASVAAGEDIIRRFVAADYPDQAEAITDYVTTTLAGLSAKAREGQDLERLLSTARLAGMVLAQALRGADG
jgi:TetR/AcrR family transcriptional repressor for divergent bdcA